VRRPRLLAIAVLTLAVALTPLSAVTAGSHFEYRYPPSGGRGGLFGHTVVVEDLTGLVAAIGPAHSAAQGTVSNVGGSGNLLVVQWLAGGCETGSRLRFEPFHEGYRIVVNTGGSRCSFLDLTGYALMMKLWLPVDAARISLESPYDSVE
jgi:hypothetical protein